MANWNENQMLRQLAFRTGSWEQPQPQQQHFTFRYNDYFHHDHHGHHPFPGADNDEPMMMNKKASSSRHASEKQLLAVGSSEANNNTTTEKNSNDQQEMMMRKRRLRSDQVDALERSFQEEVKLEPDRKMQLSRDLGLHPRQVAVWFQNRRARWKAKQLERHYYSLKQEFDIISKEKQELQQEVMRLEAKLDYLSKVMEKQGSTGAASVEETVETTSIAIQNSNGGIQGTSCDHQVAGGSYLFSIDDYNINSASLPYWGGSPGCP